MSVVPMAKEVLCRPFLLSTPLATLSLREFSSARGQAGRRPDQPTWSNQIKIVIWGGGKRILKGGCFVFLLKFK